MEIDKYILCTWWKLVGWKLGFVYFYSIFKLTIISWTLSLNFLTKSRLPDWLVKALNVPWLDGKYHKADLKTQNLQQILYLSVLLGTLWFLMELDNVLSTCFTKMRKYVKSKRQYKLHMGWQWNGWDRYGVQIVQRPEKFFILAPHFI